MAITNENYSHFGNCYKLANGEVELYVTLALGPRVICYRFEGGENILGEMGPEAVEKTELGEWHPWGGHRLWHAPEGMPRSYSPDNDPLDAEHVDSRTVRVAPKLEPETHIQKEMVISLDDSGTRVTLVHTLTNKGLWPVELAPWALTIMNGGGTTIFPQETFSPHGQSLLPARPMVLWTYTDLSDPRWSFGKKYVQLRTDEKLDFAQKIGVANKQEWAAYLRGDTLFVKRFPYLDGATYPDFGCNFETFTNGGFMEVETLAPMNRLEPGESADHVERWYLFRDVKAEDCEESLEAALTPLLAETAL